MVPGPITNRADQQKGRFGGKFTRAGRALTAEVKAVPDDDDWFQIKLRVVPEPGTPGIKGMVTFYLHQSFAKNIKSVRAVGGEAKLSVFAFGAFTVGAVIDEEQVELELDLAELSNAPKKFRQR
jgi:hypothetical protein